MAFCEQCGAKLSPGVRFCESCGARVEGGDSDCQKSTSVEVGSAIAGSISGRGSVGMFSGIFRGRDWDEMIYTRDEVIDGKTIHYIGL